MDESTPCQVIQTEDTVIHVIYDPQQPPPKPTGSQWTRFVCISDSHCATFPLPSGDVLIHAGDMTRTGAYLELKATIDWIKATSHTYKLIIGGNHDLTLDRNRYAVIWSEVHERPEDLNAIQDLLLPISVGTSRFTYLEYTTAEIELHGRKWKVFGSPGTPAHRGGAFNYRKEDALSIYANMPDDTDILITHGPPEGMFDHTHRSVSAGCSALASRIVSVRPRIHIFGHIHEARGAQILLWEDGRKTIFVNCATYPTKRGKYEPVQDDHGTRYHLPIIVDIKTSN